MNVFDSQQTERKDVLSSSKGIKDAWEQAKEKAITGLYKDDPYIRASLDAQMNTPASKPTRSVVQYDDKGNITGVEGGSVISGKNANDRAQLELWQALKNNLLKNNKGSNDGE